MSSEPSVAKMPLDSGDIAKVLSSAGPVVKCVLLKAPLSSPTDNGSTARITTGNSTHEESLSKPSETPANGGGGDDSASCPPPTPAQDDNNNKGTEEEESKPSPRVILKEQMEEIQVDTTPAKSMVAKILGGPFTFLGQYEDEGIVLMIRKLPIDLASEELPDLKLVELKALCQERDISMDQMLERSDLIQALTKWSTRQVPPFNPHQLQPPLHNERVRGDVLVLKVAETKEEMDSKEAPQNLEVPSNEEFFLNYSLDEYTQFASRTDIPEHEIHSEDDGEGSVAEEEGDTANGSEEQPHSPQGGQANEDDDEDVPFRLGDDEEIDEEDKAAMFNLVMNEVLRQYREENGRGPDTKELLEMRATIAKELDVQVTHIDADQADWNKNAKDGTPAKETAKTIGFHTEDKVLEYQPDPNEHNHHDEDYEGDEIDDENDYEGESADEEVAEDTQEPPSKRQRTEASTVDEVEQEDSKPAAVTTDPVLVAAAAASQGKKEDVDSTDKS